MDRLAGVVDTLKETFGFIKYEGQVGKDAFFIPSSMRNGTEDWNNLREGTAVELELEGGDSDKPRAEDVTVRDEQSRVQS